MAITLVLILALAQVFAIVGESIAQGRAAIEMSGSLRSVVQRLEDDLNGITVPVRPWADESGGHGYFEIVDGASQDKDGAGATETARGDIDDVLTFTTRSRGAPFVGTLDGRTDAITSPLAEVVWWIQRTDTNGNNAFDSDEPYTIYRRALLIRPDLDTSVPPFSLVSSLATLPIARTTLVTFMSQNDVSVRIEQSGAVWRIVPNTLRDLTLRQNRFAHDPGTFPHALDTNVASAYSLYRLPKAGAHFGEDVMISNALAFDVQVFDPRAPIVASPNTGESLVPGDPGFWGAVLPQPVTATYPTNAIGYGAFIDLGYGQRYLAATAGWTNFSGPPNTKSQLNSVGYVYCTWATYYERDGVDQDNANGADQGTNGFDDDNQNGVDDAGELETSPPYPTPLRGIQVRIRAWDPDSRHVRQATVATDFVPE
jgi:hypothetical protein